MAIPLGHRAFPSAVLILALCSGCSSDRRAAASADDGDAQQAVRSEVERGPVKLTVEVSPGKPRLSDEPKLTLTIRAAKGVQVRKPPFGEALGEFVIRDFHEPLPDSDDERQIIRQVYTLEATRAGKLTVAPIAVRFVDQRPDGDGQEHAIESEALVVEVSTVLGEETPTLADLRGPAGPLELPAAGLGIGWRGFGGVAAVAALWWAWRRRRRATTAAELQLSPQELAWLELEQIIEANLAHSDVKQYYVALTGVVRRYIERSTGVRAPEQTTEEFLREIAGNDLFAPDEQRRLRDFLEAADLVKFAGFEPQAGDVAASFEKAQRFIGIKREAPREVAA